MWINNEIWISGLSSIAETTPSAVYVVCTLVFLAILLTGLVYIPSTGCVFVSSDVVLDEDFLSTVSYTHSSVPGGLLHQPPSHPSFRTNQDVKTPEDPCHSTNDDSLGTPHVQDASDVLLVRPTPFSRFPWKNILLTAYLMEIGIRVIRSGILAFVVCFTE